MKYRYRDPVEAWPAKNLMEAFFNNGFLPHPIERAIGNGTLQFNRDNREIEVETARGTVCATENDWVVQVDDDLSEEKQLEVYTDDGFDKTFVLDDSEKRW